MIQKHLWGGVVQGPEMAERRHFDGPTWNPSHTNSATPATPSHYDTKSLEKTFPTTNMVGLTCVSLLRRMQSEGWFFLILCKPFSGFEGFDRSQGLAMLGVGLVGLFAFRTLFPGRLCRPSTQNPKALNTNPKPCEIQSSQTLEDGPLCVCDLRTFELFVELFSLHSGISSTPRGTFINLVYFVFPWVLHTYKYKIIPKGA